VGEREGKKKTPEEKEGVGRGGNHRK